jgi:hypothetical protein
MKLWFTTANPLQRSRYGEISSPEGKKMSIINRKDIVTEVIRMLALRVNVNSNNTVVMGNIDIFYE